MIDKLKLPDIDKYAILLFYDFDLPFEKLQCFFPPQRLFGKILDYKDAATTFFPPKWHPRTLWANIRFISSGTTFLTRRWLCSLFCSNYHTYKGLSLTNYFVILTVSEHEKEIEKEKEIPVPVDFKPREDWRGRLEEADRESHDSLDEYGGTDAYFTEDGSFVGEVSGHKKKEPSQEEVQHPVV